jgi:hypothetical protein
VVLDVVARQRDRKRERERHCTANRCIMQPVVLKTSKIHYLSDPFTSPLLDLENW